MTTWAVLASGPSMSQEVADSVRSLSVVAVSNTYELAPWANAVVSGDRTWWTNNPQAKEFAGEKFCGLCVEPPKGVTKFSGAMSGSNSALLAIQIAVNKGATRVLLLGVDLHGKHYFGDHKPPLKNPTDQRMEVFKRQFAAYKPNGVEIINCSPDSALKCYPFGEVKDFIPQPEPEEVDLAILVQEAVAELPKPQDGKNGKDGKNGADGKDGARGPIGPMPDHQWDGTSLRFEEPDGNWGKYVDLKGDRGAQGSGASGPPGPPGPGGGGNSYFPSGW